MQFATPLIQGTLIKRHRRFLADIELASGKFITTHTSNTGSMLGCQDPGSTVWLSQSHNPKRKYPHTWEIIEVKSDGKVIPVGINTLLSNSLVREAIENGTVKELHGYDEIRTEMKYGDENSRIDLLLSSSDLDPKDLPLCYVEVKNVTLVRNSIAYFPDAVSKRGAKHLRELMGVVRQGMRAIIFFCIQRGDVQEFRPADNIDPVYGSILREAIENGVEPIAYIASVSNQKIVLENRVPVIV